MNFTRFSEKLLSTTGAQELGTFHQRLVEEYNKIEPLPANYKVSLNDPWCAIYVSAMWHKWMTGYWFPFECSCTRMIAAARARNKFYASNNSEGKVGWLMFYDWERDGSPDHVGYIIDIDKKLNRVRTIEGNYSNMVKERYISIGDRRIFGYVALEYENDEVDTAKFWATKNEIMLGDGTDTYWKNPPTREQLATILYRFYTKT